MVLSSTELSSSSSLTSTATILSLGVTQNNHNSNYPKTILSGPPPLILHQILPPNSTRYQKFIESWSALDTTNTSNNDDKYFNFTHKTYGDEDLYSIVSSLGSTKLLHGWSNMTRIIERVDFARYALLYLYGGIYADADQELVDPFGMKVLWQDITTTTTFTRNATMIPITNTIVLPFEKGGIWGVHCVGQAFMVSSAPRQPFWMDLMHFLIDRYNTSCSELVNTGPLGVTAFHNALFSSGSVRREKDTARQCHYYQREGSDEYHAPIRAAAITTTNQGNIFGSSSSIGGYNGASSDTAITTTRIWTSQFLDGRVDAKSFNHSYTIHHSSGSWIDKNNEKRFQEHLARMQSCPIPTRCEHCDSGNNNNKSMIIVCQQNRPTTKLVIDQNLQK